MAYIEGIQVDGETYDAISIVKSESQVPFLEISDRDGDLELITHNGICLLYTSPSPRDGLLSRMPSSA